MASPSCFNRAPFCKPCLLAFDAIGTGVAVQCVSRLNRSSISRSALWAPQAASSGWGDSPMALPKAFCPDQANCNPLRDGLQTPLRCCRRDQDISAAVPKRAFGMLFKFLGSAGAPFLRPGLQDTSAPRGAAVKTGRRPSPEAARSGLDGREHGARLDQVGSYLSRRAVVPSGLQLSAARKRCPGSRVAASARRAGVQRPGRREHGAMLDGSGVCTSSQGIQSASNLSLSV
jgi:hypothetical protein